MKLNITKGLFLIGAIAALSSCSTQNKLASAKGDSYDDVYNTTAKAGDQPVYAERVSNYRHDNYTTTVSDYGDDYYTYDSYSARLNRFYNSPFALSYYDNLYYGSVNPYFNPYFGTGLGLSLSYGIGSAYYGSYYPYTYAYNPYYYNYGSGPLYGLGYGTYGYGGYYGSPYGGVYSYYNTVGGNYATARPYRGSGLGNSTYPATGRTTVVYPPSSSSHPPRPTSFTPSTPSTNTNQPVVQQMPQPNYQPQPQRQSFPSSNSGGGSSSSGGGGARPVRP